MPRAKIAVTIDEHLLARLDQMVRERCFPSRSRAVQDALQDKLDRLEKGRLIRECAKLDPNEERALAEEGMAEDSKRWPKY
jgi:metal-responsive CopG/Arc/MetJ family transcriptional regulator